MIRCPNCRQPNEETRRYCRYCGTNWGDTLPKGADGYPIYLSAGSPFIRPNRRPRRLGGWRYDLLADVHGRVLELGVRSGPNFRYYPADVQVIATDINVVALRDLKSTVANFNQVVALSLADAQHLPFAMHSFDAVVATLVFWSIPNPTLALREIARLLKPGGRLYTIDHVRAEQPLVGKLMDILAPVYKICSAGCNLNRRTEDIIQAAGYKIERRKIALGGVMRWLVSEPPVSQQSR